MHLGIPPYRIKNLLESNPLKSESRFRVRGLTALPWEGRVLRPDDVEPQRQQARLDGGLDGAGLGEVLRHRRGGGGGCGCCC